MNFSVKNDTIPEKCNIFPGAASGAWPGEGGLEGFRVCSWLFFAPGGCVCVCVHHFSLNTFIFRCSCRYFSESPQEKEEQNAVTPDGKYYALVNVANVSLLTLAFRLN